jgi:ELWxxDGT repeat protein
METDLWRSDGTAEGTVRLTDDCAGRYASFYGDPLAVQGRVYVTAGDRSSGAELWVSDGAPGTARMVRDLCPGPCSGEPGNQRRSWRTRGTPETTEKLLTLLGWLEQALVPLGDRAVFVLGTAEGREEVWTTDGTAAGSQRLLATDFFGIHFLPAGGRAFFFVGGQLWTTDGTAAGTLLVRDLEPPLEAPEIPVPNAQAALGDELLFSAGIAIGTTFETAPLFISDGTPAGTRILRGDVERAYGFIPWKGSLLFTSPRTRSDHIRATLWRTDGTAAGTRAVIQLTPGDWPPTPSLAGSFLPAATGSTRTESTTTSCGGPMERATAPCRWPTSTASSRTGAVSIVRAPPPILSRGSLSREGRWSSRRTTATTAGSCGRRTARPAAPDWCAISISAAVRGSTTVAITTRKPVCRPIRGTSSLRAAALCSPPTTAGPAGSSGGPAARPHRLLSPKSHRRRQRPHLCRRRRRARPGGLAQRRHRRRTRIVDDFNPGSGAAAPGPFTRAGSFVFTGAADGTHDRGLWPIPLSDVLRSPP